MVAPALNEQTSALQVLVNDGTGGWLVGVVVCPGLITTEKFWSPPVEVLVVAVRAAALPTATAPLESASRALTLPPPVPAGVARVVLVAGLVHVVAVEDFSLQALTSQELPWATATAGAEWLVEDAVAATLAEAVTEEVPPLLR